MSDDVWRILKIAATDDIKQIKRAYAQQLRLHPPQTDPQGFARLRSAYERALELAPTLASERNLEQTVESTHRVIDEVDHSGTDQTQQALSQSAVIFNSDNDVTDAYEHERLQSAQGEGAPQWQPELELKRVEPAEVPLQQSQQHAQPIDLEQQKILEALALEQQALAQMIDRLCQAIAAHVNKPESTRTIIELTRKALTAPGALSIDGRKQVIYSAMEAVLNAPHENLDYARWLDKEAGYPSNDVLVSKSNNLLLAWDVLLSQINIKVPEASALEQEKVAKQFDIVRFFRFIADLDYRNHFIGPLINIEDKRIGDGGSWWKALSLMRMIAFVAMLVTPFVVGLIKSNSNTRPINVTSGFSELHFLSMPSVAGFISLVYFAFLVFVIAKGLRPKFRDHNFLMQWWALPAGTVCFIVAMALAISAQSTWQVTIALLFMLAGFELWPLPIKKMFSTKGSVLYLGFAQAVSIIFSIILLASYCQPMNFTDSADNRLWNLATLIYWPITLRLAFCIGQTPWWVTLFVNHAEHQAEQHGWKNIDRFKKISGPVIGALTLAIPGAMIMKFAMLPLVWIVPVAILGFIGVVLFMDSVQGINSLYNFAFSYHRVRRYFLAAPIAILIALIINLANVSLFFLSIVIMIVLMLPFVFLAICIAFSVAATLFPLGPIIANNSRVHPQPSSRNHLNAYAFHN